MEKLRARVDWINAKETALAKPKITLNRVPYFCSGCPHNRSTLVPEGSVNGGGIGCHAMVALTDRPRSEVSSITQMGGEGAQWIGQSPFLGPGEAMTPVQPSQPADEIVGQGCVCGHTTALTGAPLGPRAVARGPVRLVEIPRKAVAAAFSSPEAAARALGRAAERAAWLRRPGGPSATSKAGKSRSTIAWARLAPPQKCPPCPFPPPARGKSARSPAGVCVVPLQPHSPVA